MKTIAKIWRATEANLKCALKSRKSLLDFHFTAIGLPGCNGNG